MLKRLKALRIRERLRKSYQWVITIFAVLSVLVVGVMLFVASDYRKVLDNYAYPQGDIAMAMNATAEMRSAVRGIIGYDEQSTIDSLMEQYDAAIADFEQIIEDEVRPTMITEEGHACMDAVDAAWEEYRVIQDEVVAMGATTNREACKKAQDKMINEAAPKYEALDEAMLALMDVNLSKGNQEESMVKIILMIAVIAIVVTIIGVIIFSMRLAMGISAGIEGPLKELALRFETFAEGDLDSPMPEIDTKDEISELVDSIRNMADRLNLIIGDCGHLLHEMAQGNFAIKTSCEEQYTGAFRDLLMGIRAMNRQIDTTIKGVDEASRQVAEGSSNMAEAAQALAEGATDQAATVEEVQATINELNNGIQSTAKELESSYQEAKKYALTAEDSRADMEALMTAMVRISDASEKIGNIIAEIEDIASQTNLLSLNASIEAARAGDAGRGFAVVADQIRTLAEQSAKSAVDSKELIETSIHEVKEGSKIATKASDSLKEVVEGVQSIAESAKKMSEVSMNQATGMGQADMAVARIAEVVQNNSAAAEESSATSEELSAEATTLSGMVAKFKLRE